MQRTLLFTKCFTSNELVTAASAGLHLYTKSLLDTKLTARLVALPRSTCAARVMYYVCLSTI